MRLLYEFPTGGRKLIFWLIDLPFWISKQSFLLLQMFIEQEHQFSKILSPTYANQLRIAGVVRVYLMQIEIVIDRVLIFADSECLVEIDEV